MDIQQLVFEFFRLCNLRPVEIRKGIWQVQVPDDLAKELDGWRARGGLFQFTFDRKLAENYGAELISAGSYRLDSILSVVRSQATLSEATLPLSTFYEPNIRQKLLSRFSVKSPGSRLYVLNHSANYSPYLWLVLRISYLSYEKQEELRKPLIDLNSGRVVNYEIPVGFFVPGKPEGSVLRKRLSYKQAYKNLQQQLTNSLSMEDQSWAIEARNQLEQEKEQLEEYYQNDEDDGAKSRRVHELMERAHPRVQVRPLRGAIVYMPKYHYRIMEVQREEKVHDLTYDPVSLQWDISS